MKTNYIGKCPVKNCQMGLVIRISTDGSPYNLGLECVRHHTQIGFRKIEGHLNPAHICDSRCTHAKGHTCDCSCGGANHASQFAL